MINVTPKINPVLDPGFTPAVLWNREYLRLVNERTDARDVLMRIIRNDQVAWDYRTRVFPNDSAYAELNLFYLERLLHNSRFLCWTKKMKRHGQAVAAASLPTIEPLHV